MTRGPLLRWIVAFKAFKAIALTALGIGLLATRHADLTDLLIRLALTLHLPVTSELFDRILTLAASLTIHKQTALAVTAFGYAALMGTEGVGLHLRRSWARWFTIIATSSLLPVEVYEIAREADFVRILIFLLNIGVVVYLYRRKEIFEDEPSENAAVPEETT